LQILEYLKTKQQKRLVPNTPRKQYCLEVVVLQLGFDYLFVGIYKELPKTTGKSIVDVDKPVTTSNVVNKVIEVAVEEY
jgi:cytochrome c oxidase assembly protein Cox11